MRKRKQRREKEKAKKRKRGGNEKEGRERIDLIRDKREKSDEDMCIYNNSRLSYLVSDA